MADKADRILVALTGLPASGKSTLAARLAKELDTRAGRVAMTISSDTVRDELPSFEHGFKPELENAVRRLTLARVREAIEEGFSAIHDDLNYYRSMRRQLFVLARDLRVPFFLLHLATPAKTCLQLNEARGRKIPDIVIITDDTRFDPPGEVAWDTPFECLEAMSITDDMVSAMVERMISEAPKQIPPLEEMRTGTREKTRREELENLSRRVLGRLYKQHRSTKDPAALREKRIELVQEASDRALEDAPAEELFEQALSPFFAP